MERLSRAAAGHRTCLSLVSLHRLLPYPNRQEVSGGRGEVEGTVIENENFKIVALNSDKCKNISYIYFLQRKE